MRPHSWRLPAAAIACAGTVLLASCVAVEPRPPGVPRSIVFGVTPVYPRSFDIVAASNRRTAPEILKQAWRKKAEMVANGRRFKSTELVVHDTEAYVPTGQPALPRKARRVSGTITLLE